MDIKNKIIVITGGSAGIGLVTAQVLASQGAELLLISENERELKKAAEQINETTGNLRVKYIVSDLTIQSDIMALAQTIKKQYQHIDILINNAGAVFHRFEKTEDGLEKTIAINFIAPFLLTHLLLDLLRKGTDARIINVASRSHYDGQIDINLFTNPPKSGPLLVIKDFILAGTSLKILYLFVGQFLMKAYAQSKLANIIFTIDLAQKLQAENITVNSLHPGFIRTQIGNKNTPWYSGLLMQIVSSIAGESVEQGAAAIVYLTTSDEVAGVTGHYFENNKITTPSPVVYDKTIAQKVLQEGYKYLSNLSSQTLIAFK